jgi:hypothetical protein
MRLAPLLLTLTAVVGACVPTGSPVDDAAPVASVSPAPPSPTPLSPTSDSSTSTGPAASGPTGPVPCPTAAAIRAVTWTTAEGGRSLAVEPHEQLRRCGGPSARWTGAAPGWDEVVELSGPEADSPAMAQQYACHLRYARSKASWNLEPWRPHVADEDLLLAGCNP